MHYQTGIVIDNNIMTRYGSKAIPQYSELFAWLAFHGVLVVSQKLLVEYSSTYNPSIFNLLQKLESENRLIKIKTKDIDECSGFKRFKFTCNYKDHSHVKLVTLSPSKKLISEDDKLVKDVNSLPLLNGRKAKACKLPARGFYDPTLGLVCSNISCPCRNFRNIQSRPANNKS